MTNVFARKPAPPTSNAPPTTFCSDDMLLSPIEFATSTPSSDIGADPKSIQSASRAWTVPSWRWRTAPNDLKIAPCRMSVPTATFALNPKSRIRIGVIRLPPPMPVIPTSTPTSRPASENCQVTRAGAGSGRKQTAGR